MTKNKDKPLLQAIATKISLEDYKKFKDKVKTKGLTTSETLRKLTLEYLAS